MEERKYDKLWRNEFCNNVCEFARLHGINLNRIKFRVNESFKKDETLTTNHYRDENVVSKGSLDAKKPDVKNPISFTEKEKY